MSEQGFYLLRGENDSSDGALYPLGELPCTVGRSPNCQLQLDYERISREHARFDYLDGQLQLSDLGSTNGTFINHRRLDQPEHPEPITADDTIHFGNHAFVLKVREPSGDTLVQAAGDPRQANHDTIVGFTARPTGFPVQAPEFFDMLNDEQLEATAQPVVTRSGTAMALSLSGRSAHPELTANANRLFNIAEDLGEEVRLAQLIRRIALEQASRRGLQSTLLLPVHAAEYEDPDILVGEWQQLVKRHRHLALACDLPLAGLADPEDLLSLRSHLAPLEVEICGTAKGLSAQQLVPFRGELDYLRVSAMHGPDRIPELIGTLGSFVRILIEGVDEPGLIEAFSDAGAVLFQGDAVGARVDMTQLA
jgi:hypothetical protein